MKTLILLIPGNPSVPGIYDPFLNTVVDDLSLEGEVIHQVLPHLGQCNTVTKKHKKIGVHDVISHHNQKIKDLQEIHQPTKTILIGHSLGSAVTISLYEDFQDSIDQFIVLCPFLGPSKNNERYLRLFEHPVSRAGMQGITQSALKSQKLSRMIFKRWLGENPFNDLIPNEIRKPFYTYNFFNLVGSYFDDFEKLNMKERIKKMAPEKSFFVFAPNDYWVPDDTVFHLPQLSRFRKIDTISHDFCLKKDQYLTVSKAIADHLLTV